MMCYSNEHQLFQSFDLSLQKKKKVFQGTVVNMEDLWLWESNMSEDFVVFRI